MGAVGDRLQHAVMRQCGRIAVALDLQFHRRHGERDVDGQHEFDVDRLGGASGSNEDCGGGCRKQYAGKA